MLASRDQENLVHAHQQAAAAKPLNQGLKQLQPKTPRNRAPKTPYKFALNGENAAAAFSGQKRALRQIGKENENVLQTSKEDGKVDKTTFVTPSGLQARAPLGMKTTNAKARAFETQPATQAKPLPTASRPSTIGTKRKPKIVIAQPEPTQSDILAKEDEDVPDIEYMPPKSVELADPPEEITYDDTFPQFQGRSMFKGWVQLYGPPIGEDGLTDSQREQEARFKRSFERDHGTLEQQIKDDKWRNPEMEADLEVQRLIRGYYEGKRKGVDTVNARRAATTLNTSAQKTSILSRPTLASQQKTRNPPTNAPDSRKTSSLGIDSSRKPHIAGAAASRNTVGYSKGRAVSNKLSGVEKQSYLLKQSLENHFEDNTKLDQYNMSPQQFTCLCGEPPVGSEMWYRLHENELFPKPDYLIDDLRDELEDLRFKDTPLVEGEVDGEVFQLKWP